MLRKNWDDYPEHTKKVVGELYDHLLSHPFFDTSIRIALGIDPQADVTENEDYGTAMSHLIDETLIALGQCNRQGSNKQ